MIISSIFHRYDRDFTTWTPTRGHPYALFGLILLLWGVVPPVMAQTEVTLEATSCGLVDAIRYPVDSVTTVTIPEGYDDFDLSRGQFGAHHTGIDMAFYEQGAPVYAIARGRVTFADIHGWEDERGVVVIEHQFPDGAVYYSVYGHIEETTEWSLPTAGDCVEMGDIVGAIGWPTSSSPHTHFEIRRILPNEGGPGYSDGNPLVEGWYHPLDFIQLWQIRLTSAFVDYVALDTPSAVTPDWLENGGAALAVEDAVLVTAPDQGGTLWQVTLDTMVNKVAALPGNQVAARSRNGLTIVVSGGRYSAAWTVTGPDTPFILLGETLFLVTDGGGVAAYTSSGVNLWTTPPGETAVGAVRYFDANGSTIGLAIETDTGVLWRVWDTAGTLQYEATFGTLALVAPISFDGWMLLADGVLYYMGARGNYSVGAVTVELGRAARLAADALGNTYLYIGDEQHTLLSWDGTATLRWQTTIPEFSPPLYAPLLALDGSCLLYVLDADGRLYGFDARSGGMVAQTSLYAGGDRNRQPDARLLQVDPATGYIQFSAGYLTLVRLNGRILGADVFATCSLG